MNILNNILPYFSSFIKPDWTVYKDVKYGLSSDETADLYLLNHGVRPVVVFIHGGGWSSGDKSAYDGRARRYALAGFHVVAINYRLAKFEDKTTQWPAQLQDVQLALRWIRENAINFRIDPYRVAVGGDSAGGHLALMLGCNSHTVPGDRSNLYPNMGSFPNAIINMFGPSNLAGPGMRQLVETLPLFNAQTYEQVPELYNQASPLYLMNAFFPPTVITHGTSDDTVPYIQSVLLNDKLTKLGVRHKFITFNGGHELAKVSNWEQLRIEMQCLDFVRSVLKP